MDIRFYDFNLNLVKVLPPSGNKCGYSSINTSREFCGTGSLEIVFYDTDLQKIVEQYDDNLIVSWNGFQGFLTGHIWKDTEFRLLGMHLNGIIHRIVFPYLSTANYTVEEAVYAMFAKAQRQQETLTWITYIREEGFTEKYSIGLDTYQNADTAVKDILTLDGAGYLVYVDFTAKKMYFKCLKPKENPIVISSENKNAYDMEISKSNKEYFSGGYYHNESKNTWEYVGKSNGIFSTDCVLEATSFGAAASELKKKNKMYDITAQTKGIKEGTDYSVGDIVRLQVGGVSVKKKVSGISKHIEKEYGEEPTFTEV